MWPEVTTCGPLILNLELRQYEYEKNIVLFKLKLDPVEIADTLGDELKVTVAVVVGFRLRSKLNLKLRLYKNYH